MLNHYDRDAKGKYFTRLYRLAEATGVPETYFRQFIGKPNIEQVKVNGQDAALGLVSLLNKADLPSGIRAKLRSLKFSFDSGFYDREGTPTIKY